MWCNSRRQLYFRLDDNGFDAYRYLWQAQQPHQRCSTRNRLIPKTMFLATTMQRQLGMGNFVEHRFGSNHEHIYHILSSINELLNRPKKQWALLVKDLDEVRSLKYFQQRTYIFITITSIYNIDCCSFKISMDKKKSQWLSPSEPRIRSIANEMLCKIRCFPCFCWIT